MKTVLKIIENTSTEELELIDSMIGYFKEKTIIDFARLGRVKTGA